MVGLKLSGGLIEGTPMAKSYIQIMKGFAFGSFPPTAIIAGDCFESRQLFLLFLRTVLWLFLACFFFFCFRLSLRTCGEQQDGHRLVAATPAAGAEGR